MSDTKTTKEEVKNTKLVILGSTQRAIAEFFLKTSVPRILKKMKEKK